MKGTFEAVIGNLKLLKIPFGTDWTGVVLVDDEKKILIDSGALATDVDTVLIPALGEEGYTLNDIDYLINTHSHGDHIGGHARIRELSPHITVVAADSDRKNVEDPASLAIRTRGQYPAVSPTPQSYLKGVCVDRVLGDGEELDGILTLIETPGHDGGCVCWYDKKTKTVITGDSLQGNGTGAQGIGFYQSLDAYRSSLHKLLGSDVENILCGHDYDQLGYWICGKEAAEDALQRCFERTEVYQTFVDGQLSAGHTDPKEIAEALIRQHGCGVPSYLFMAVYTVCEHIRHSSVKLNG